MRIALAQMQSGIDPRANSMALVEAIEAAAKGGAAMLFTPEMSGLLDRNRGRAGAHIVPEDQDIVLADVRKAAADYGIWVSLRAMTRFTSLTWICQPVKAGASLRLMLLARKRWLPMRPLVDWDSASATIFGFRPCMLQ